MGASKDIEMISLDSPYWSELKHAYGPASDIPALLKQLQSMPSSEADKEPWFSLWSALAHQGDVYSASFAAVPHVIHFLSQAPSSAASTYFQFPAWIEICRQKKTIPIPEELEKDYFAALATLPSLVAASANDSWDAEFLCCALSAIAASKGFGSVAEVALEMSPEVTHKFMRWFENQ